MDNLKKIYGSTRTFDGQAYVLHATSEDQELALRVARNRRTAKQKARVTRVGNRGIKDSIGAIRKNCFAIWVRFD